jgi:FlaA1/EpsC-like NDP-sugar epimerase
MQWIYPFLPPRPAPEELACELGTVFRMFQGQWRHAGIEGVVVMTKAVFVGSLSSGLLLWIIPQLGIRSVGVPAIDFLLLPFLILGERCSFQILKHLYISRNGQTSFNNLQSPIAVPPHGGAGSGEA